MPKLKHKVGNYKYVSKPLEALSEHILRMRLGGTTYGVPVTTLSDLSWSDTSNVKSSEPFLGSRIRLRKGATTYSIRSETSYTDSHTDVSHSDSHADWSDHSNTYSDWGNVGAWSDSGQLWIDNPTEPPDYNTALHFNYSDTIRSTSLLDNIHGNWTNGIPHHDWTDTGKASFSWGHVDGASTGYIDYIDAGYGTYKSGSYHANWSNHSDSHSDSYPHSDSHSDIAHSDTHSNWYDIAKEAI
jgi:hypothetical protein